MSRARDAVINPDAHAMAAARTRLQDWEIALRGSAGHREAERLRDAVVDPAEADAEKVWRVLWDKPLYAATRVKAAENNIAMLEPHMAGAWARIGLDATVMQLSFEGRQDRKDVYRGEGDLFDKARVRPIVAMHRLFRIQSAAQLLRDWVSVDRERPARHLRSVPLSRLVPKLQGELGRGWGHITVLHLLTDLGLAVKPDLHLAASVRELGLCDEKVGRVPTLEQAIQINEAVSALSDVFGAGPRALRYTDKILMEASRQRLFISRQNTQTREAA